MAEKNVVDYDASRLYSTAHATGARTKLRIRDTCCNYFTNKYFQNNGVVSVVAQESSIICKNAWDRFVELGAPSFRSSGDSETGV